MSKTNEHTGDRITNALKGDKEKYRENWEAIFGKEKTVEDADEELLDEITQMNEDMGLYND